MQNPLSRPALRAALAALALLTAASASADAGPSSAPERVAALRAQAQSQAGSVEALIALHRLMVLKGELEELAPLEDAFDAVAANRRALPEVSALARFYGADVKRARGFVNRAQDDEARLGFLTRFRVIGAFDNEGKSGFDRAFPPESELDFGKRYPGKQREIGWRTFDAAGLDGFIDLGAALRPNREVTAFAQTDLELARDARVVLHLGASGATKLFVDGQKVLEDRQFHPAALDQHGVAVTLRKGTHHLLLKLAHDGGAMGFYLRASGPRGEPLPMLTTHLADKQLAPPRGSLSPEVLTPAVDVLAKRVGAQPQNAPLLAQLAELLAFTRVYDAKDRKPAQVSARAAALAPGDADIQLLAARLEQEDVNTRRGYLEAAARAAPERLQPQLELARDDLSRGHPDRAATRLHAVLERADTVEGQLLLARAEDDLGDFPAAQRRVQQTLRAHPRSIQALREAAHQARRLDRRREVIGDLRVALSLRYDDLESRRGLILELLQLGEIDGALAEEDKLLQLDPSDTSTLTRRAELLAANGRLPAAREAFARAIALCPEDSDLREREGKALLEQGDGPGAQKSFEASLALRPQNPRLKEALRTLQGNARGFGEEYAADARALLAAYAAPQPGEDAEILSSLVAVKVNANGTSTRYVQRIARANTERGVDELRSYAISYSPDRQQVSVLHARTFLADGSVVEAHGEGDHNLSEPWANMYYDSRSRVVSFPNLRPGDTVELAYRLDDAARDNLLSDYFGDLHILQDTMTEHRESYVLEAPSSRPIYASTPRIKPAEATTTAQGADTLYRWSWREVPRLQPEPRMPGWAEASATLHVSTYKDWASVGRFYWGMVRDQLVATDEVKRTAAQLGAGIAPGDDLAKVRAVYDFVVSQTRYVALEFGIHGYKPYAVDRILSRHFGDCKDKASLMHALLEELGVPSNLTLVRTRQLGDVDAQPASLAVFNHAILYVPKFDLFLDGTAEYYGSSELPAGDQGAMVLVVKPEGESQLAHAPPGKAEQNLTESTYDVALSRDGSAHVTAKSQVTGVNAPDYRRAYATVATRRATFEQAWSRTFPGLAVEKVDLGDTAQLEKPVNLEFAMQVPHYGEAQPEGMRLSPFSKVHSYLESYAPLSQRQFDLVLDAPWVNHFTYRYRLPEGVGLAGLPPAFDRESPFGAVHLSYKQDGGQLVCEGTIRFATARVKVADYAAFRGFLADVDQALQRKVDLTTALPPPGVERPAAPRAANP